MVLSLCLFSFFLIFHKSFILFDSNNNYFFLKMLTCPLPNFVPTFKLFKLISWNYFYFYDLSLSSLFCKQQYYCLFNVFKWLSTVQPNNQLNFFFSSLVLWYWIWFWSHWGHLQVRDMWHLRRVPASGNWVMQRWRGDEVASPSVSRWLKCDRRACLCGVTAWQQRARGSVCRGVCLCGLCEWETGWGHKSEKKGEKKATELHRLFFF